MQNAWRSVSPGIDFHCSLAIIVVKQEITVCSVNWIYQELHRRIPLRGCGHFLEIKTDVFYISPPRSGMLVQTRGLSGEMIKHCVLWQVETYKEF